MRVMMNAHLPDLVVELPKCGWCRSTAADDGDGMLWCERCGVEWSNWDDGASSQFRLEEPSCGESATEKQEEDYIYGYSRYELGEFQPCILPEGHDSAHLHPYEMTVTLIDGDTPTK